MQVMLGRLPVSVVGIDAERVTVDLPPLRGRVLAQWYLGLLPPSRILDGTLYMAHG